MENLVHDIVAPQPPEPHHRAGRKRLLGAHGGRSDACGVLRSSKTCTILDEGLTIKSSLKEEQLAQMDALAQAIYRQHADHARARGPRRMPSPSSRTRCSPFPTGCYVLTARDGEKDNGCIINTVMQHDRHAQAHQHRRQQGKLHPRHDQKDGRVQRLSSLAGRAVCHVPALRLPVRPRCRQVCRRADAAPRATTASAMSPAARTPFISGQGHRRPSSSRRIRCSLPT